MSLTPLELKHIRRRNLLATSICKLLHGFGTNIFSVVYQPFLLEVTNSIVLTGIIVSLGSIMQFLPMPLIGKLADRYSRKLLIILSIPIYILGLSLLILASPSAVHYAVLGILFYFLGFIINNLNSQFIVSESSTKSKGLMYGFMFFSYFLGSIGGSILIIIENNLQIKSYFVIFLAVLAIEGLIYGVFLSSKTQIIHLDFLKKKKENLWLKIFKIKSLRSILIFFSLDIFVYGLTLSIYNAGLYDFYKITTENIAILSMGMNITNMIFQIPAGRITDKLGTKKTLILSQFFGFFFFMMNIITVILWVNNVISTVLITLLIGYISIALSIVTFIPAEQIILTDLDRHRKAESYGIINFFRGIGSIPTGYLGALIVENIGYIFPFIFSIIGVGIELLFLLRFFHHHPNSYD